MCFYNLSICSHRKHKTTNNPFETLKQQVAPRKQSSWHLCLGFLSANAFNRKTGSNKSEQVAGLDDKCFLHVPWCGFPALRS